MTVIDEKTIKDCIFGHAVGDALGVPVEFCSREELEGSPVTDMQGFGSYPVPAGSWSDDTSMTLCALEALSQERFSWESVMDNFCRWYYEDAFTPAGEMFDVGNTCSFAIENYHDFHVDVDHCGSSDPHSNGNGSLMRIIPFALKTDDFTVIEKASALTHAHRRSKIACCIYASILRELISRQDKAAWKNGLRQAAAKYGNDPEWKHFQPLPDIESRSRNSIRSSGYVVDTLEAALWCFVTTDSYRDCVLKAVNLGDDTDTVAAVAGGLAGALYGLEGIPDEWLNALLRKDYINELCGKAAQRWGRQ